jgi:hypothetical protein
VMIAMIQKKYSLFSPLSRAHKLSIGSV